MNFLQTLRAANERRHQEWAAGADIPLSFRGLELAGEAGEACNELKKIERARLGMVGGQTDQAAIADELADVLICLDLIAMDLQIDLEAVTRAKFNRTSVKYGLETQL